MQGQQARAPQQPRDLGHVAVAPNERGDFLRQVARDGRERAQHGKFAPQLGMHELVQVLRRGDVAQPHGPEVVQRALAREARADQIGDDVRQQHLSAVTRGHDALRAIHRGAEEIAIAMLDHTGVQSAANVQRNLAA